MNNHIIVIMLILIFFVLLSVLLFFIKKDDSIGTLYLLHDEDGGEYVRIEFDGNGELDRLRSSKQVVFRIRHENYNG